MRKMPCLFVREFHDRHSFTITEQVTPEAAWVLEPETTVVNPAFPFLVANPPAYRKRDGTACLWYEGQLFKRYDAKAGKTPPPNAIPCQPEPDPATGHWPHWLLVGDEPESRWHRETAEIEGPLPNGTYELCGPRLQGNPENLPRHTFIRHTSEPILIPSASYTFEGLREVLRNAPGEGVVWHHPDGRMAKLRRDDFGFSWPILGAP